MLLLEHVGVPKVYGTFANGYVYEFIEGEPLNAARLRSDPRLLQLAADALVVWHMTPLFGDLSDISLSDASECVFRRIAEWRELSVQLLELDDECESRGSRNSSTDGAGSPRPEFDLTTHKSQRMRDSFSQRYMRDASSSPTGSPLSDHDSGSFGQLPPGSPDTVFDFDDFVKRLPRYVARTRELIAQAASNARVRVAPVVDLALRAAVCHLDANAGNAILSVDRITWVDVECALKT